MTYLRKLLDLPAADRSLLVHAACLLALTRLGLWLLPVHPLRFLLAKLVRKGVRAVPQEPADADRIAWAVAVAGRFVPGARCLPQALAAQALLARRGQPTRLRIGVAMGDRKPRLQAHAWLEQRGKVVLGGSRAPSLYRSVPVSFVK